MQTSIAISEEELLAMTVAKEAKEKHARAKKIVQTSSVKDGYLIVTIGYNTELVLPYKDGISVMAALVNAEQFSGYGQEKKIGRLERDSFKATVLSYQDYEQYKIAVILGISYDDLKESNKNEDF